MGRSLRCGDMSDSNAQESPGGSRTTAGVPAWSVGALPDEDDICQEKALEWSGYQLTV